MIDFKKILIKSIRTMAQTLGGILAVGVTLSDINWGAAMSATVLAGAICFLMGVADEDNTYYPEEGDRDFVDDPDDDETVEH